MEQLDQVAQRSEDLDAEQQDDQQRRQRQLASLDPDRAPAERQRGAGRDAEQRDPAGRRY